MVSSTVLGALLLASVAHGAVITAESDRTPSLDQDGFVAFRQPEHLQVLGGDVAPAWRLANDASSQSSLTIAFDQLIPDDNRSKPQCCYIEQQRRRGVELELHFQPTPRSVLLGEFASTISLSVPVGTHVITATTAYKPVWTPRFVDKQWEVSLNSV